MAIVAPGRRTEAVEERVRTPAKHESGPPRIESAKQARAELSHRVIVAVAALGILGPAFAIWSGIITIHLAGIASVLLTAGALALLVTTFSVKTDRALRLVELALLLLGVVALVAWAASVVAANPAYGTDEAAFEQYAASLLMSGVNPYAHSLLAALREFQVPIQYATYTTSGGVVSTLGYPAFPVLLAVPFVWMTGGVQAVPVMNTAALVASMVIAFAVLPKRYRSLAVVVTVGLPILFGYTVSGVNVIVAIPFLMVAAWRFTETGAGGKLGRRGLLQAICLGLALSVQQIAWFIFPFVVVAIFCCRERELGRRSALRVTGRYLAVSIGTFFLVNLGFIVAGPDAWLRGVLEPLIQHAIPYGQGIIDLPVFAGLGGGGLSDYTYAAVVLMLGGLVCFGIYFSSLWRCAFLLPSLALFFPTRSLAEYWATLVSVWIVSMFAAPPERWSPATIEGRFGRARRRSHVKAAGAALALLPGAALIGVAVTSPSPLSISVVKVATNGQYQRVWELTLDVTNHSHQPLQPHFATNSVGQMTPFWHRLSGPKSLGAGKSARYLLAAPNVGAMPGITDPFQIDAVTNEPATISVTKSITTDHFFAWIYQSDVNGVLRSGQTTDLTVQLRSPLGGPREKAGVTVEMGEVIYGQSQLIPAEASINGAAEGQTPIAMKTNAKGEATFRVSDTSPQGQPIYFQAWAVSKAGYPFGYSEIVDILWST